MNATQYDVFLSHNGQETPLIERIAAHLRQAGLEPWLDAWYLTPGAPWQPELERALMASKSCAVCIGPAGMGNWVREEMSVALDRAVRDPTYRIFLVLLPGAPERFEPTELPAFLSTRTWVDLRAGIEDSAAIQRLTRAVKGEPLHPGGHVTLHSSRCPYRGLQTFDEEHAEIFFGREADVQRLVERLKHGRFLAVLGPSGVGKSSVARAGLIPALRTGRIPGSDRWVIRIMTPGARPLTDLAAQLVQLDPQRPLGRTLDELMTDRRTLDLASVQYAANATPHTQIVWLVDQFEETFTLCRDEAERAHFIDNLLYAATVPGGQTIVVLTMRADFYAHCAAYPELGALIAAHQYLVSPLGADGLRQVIVEPARLTGLTFEPWLVETILNDVMDQPGALPLLEHTLLELWERRRGNLLTLEGYRESGGVQAAIAQRAESIYTSLDSNQRALVQRVLLRLTQPGEGSEDTRRPASMEELVPFAGAETEVDAAIQPLVDARLLTASVDAASGARELEVAHEALIRAWPRLREWIDENRTGLREHRRLTEATQEWQRLARDEGVLYRGTRLERALEWRAGNEAALNDLERAFLDASTDAQRREQRERQRRRHRTLAFLASSLVIVSLVAVVAVIQWVSAQRAQEQAFSRELAANALALEVTAPEEAQLSLLLGREALRIADTAQAREALRQLLLATPARSFEVPEGIRNNQPWKLAAYTPDFDLVVITTPDGAIHVFDSSSTSPPGLTDTSPMLLRGHTHWADWASISPDKSMLVTAGYDNTVRLWDLKSQHERAILSDFGMPSGAGGLVPDGPFYSNTNKVAFSPDGAQVLVCTIDGRGLIFDAQSGRQLVSFGSPDNNPVHYGHWSPDGRLVVTYSDSMFSTGAAVPNGEHQTVEVWEAGSGQPVTELNIVLTPAVQAALFTPDSSRIITVPVSMGVAVGGPSPDIPVQVWDARSGREVLRIPSSNRRGDGAASMSPDGTLFALRAGGGEVQVWNLMTGEKIRSFLGHQFAVNDVAFSPDGTILITCSQDNSVRFWDTNTGDLLARVRGTVLDVQFSPDGQWIMLMPMSQSPADATPMVLYSSAAVRASSTELLALADELIERDFTPDERARYLHD